MKPWEVVVDRIGKSLMRLIALGFVVLACWLAYLEWPSMQVLYFSPILVLFLVYGLRGERGMNEIGRPDMNETSEDAKQRLAREAIRSSDEG